VSDSGQAFTFIHVLILSDWSIGVQTHNDEQFLNGTNQRCCACWCCWS